MAEICLECLNKIMGTDDPPKKFVISRELDLCEECGERKRVVICIKKRYPVAEWMHEVTERLRKEHKD